MYITITRTELSKSKDNDIGPIRYEPCCPLPSKLKYPIHCEEVDAVISQIRHTTNF